MALFREAMNIKNPRDRLIAIQALCDKVKTCGDGGQKIDQRGNASDGNDNPAPNTGCGMEQPRYRKGQGV